MINEKNVPTNPTLWKKYVDQAKKKFDVYPSAYANGWASKQYKDAGGKWKTESVEEPEHVAVALPQTKELKGKKIGERFLEYLRDNGLNHAAYQNENGEVKIVGLNKDQVKETLGNLVKEWNSKTESVNEEVGINFKWIYKNSNGNKPAFFNTLSKSRKKFGDDYYEGMLHYTLKDYKENPDKYKTIKDKEEKLWQMASKTESVKEGFPGGVGVGLNLPGGYINGAPKAKDVKDFRKKNLEVKKKISEADEDNPDITYKDEKGETHKIKYDSAITYPKDHPAKKIADKMRGNVEKAKAEKGDTKSTTEPKKPQPTQKAEPTPTQTAEPKETPSEKQPESPKQPQPVTKKTVMDKIKGWAKGEKEWFKNKLHKGDSPERRSFGQALKDKVQGAVHAVVRGAKHEAHTFKTAAIGVSKYFSGVKPTEEESKAVRSVAIKVAVTAATSVAIAATGGVAGLAGLAKAGFSGFLKHVAAEFIPHITAETLIAGVGRAALFAGDEEQDPEKLMVKFMEQIIDKMTSSEIPPDILMKAIDSYNAEKSGQPLNPEDVNAEEVSEALREMFSETQVIKKAIIEEIRKNKTE